MADSEKVSEDRFIIKMFDLNAPAESRCLYTKMDHQTEITALEFSPNGDLFISAAYDGDLFVWDTDVSVSMALR